MIPDNLPKDELRRKLKETEKYLEDHPEDIMALLDMGMLLTYLDQLGDASIELGHAEVLATYEDDPDLLEEVYLCRGTALFLKHQHEEAISYLKKAIKINPKNGLAHYMMCNVLLKMRRNKGALYHINQAIEAQHTAPEVYYKLAYTLNRHGRHKDAVDCLRKLLRTTPEYADALCELGKSYVGLKKVKHAIICFKRAVQADPKHAISHAYLGSLYRRTGQDHLAGQHLRELLDLDLVDMDELRMLSKLKE